MGFIDLLWERHGHLLATGGAREKHIRTTYLNHDPCQLGGRAAGLPGQSGSNNSGEKKNNLIKDALTSITRHLKGDEKHNIIYVLAACAHDLRVEDELGLVFAVTPTRSIDDYNMLRDVYREALNNKKDPSSLKLILDLQFAVVTTRDKTRIIDVCDVIGDSIPSFTLHIPTASTVYTHVRQQDDLQRSSVSVASYSEQRSNRHCGDDMITTPKQACVILKDYSRNLMRSLYQNLIQDCLANTPGCKPGETFWSFVHRRCQRNPEIGSTVQTARRLKEQKKAISKQNRAKREAAEQVSLDAMKYNEQPSTAEGDAQKCTELSILTDGKEEWLDDGSAEEMIQLLTNLEFDLEGDAMLNSLMAESNRITLKRQLGSWIEVEVDASKGRVTCNCEDYNFHYLCVHQVTMEVLQFGKLPNNKCSKHHENWKEIRAECIRYLKRTSLCDHNNSA